MNIIMNSSSPSSLRIDSQTGRNISLNSAVKNGFMCDANCKKLFVEIKPDLLVNKMNILWVQKYGDCIYLSQSDKIHEVCNSQKKEDVLFNKVNDIFFDKKE